MTAKKSPIPFCGITFSIYLFAFLLTEFTINERCVALVGANYVNVVYSIGLLCTALGYLSFSMAKKLCTSSQGRIFTTFCVGAFSIVGTYTFLKTQQLTIFFIAAFASLLAFGYLGAYTHYISAMSLRSFPHTGKLLGCSIAAAVLVQFVVQNPLLTGISVFISVLICVILLCFCMLSPFQYWMIEDPFPVENKNAHSKFWGLFLVIAVVLMSVIQGLSDSIMTYMHANHTSNIISYCRLFYAIGALLAGYLADIKQRRFFGFSTACAMFVSTIAISLLSSPASYAMSNSLLYFYSGFYVLFLTLSFLDFAPNTTKPHLWAGMGRIARSIAVSITLLPTIFLYQRFGIHLLIIISCSLSLILLLFMYFSGMFFSPASATEMAEKEFSLPENNLADFSLTYHLTPREAEVLWQLLFTEDTTQQIADTLFISRRVLQRNIASIYEKTDTKSRLGLYKCFLVHANTKDA